MVVRNFLASVGLVVLVVVEVGVLGVEVVVVEFGLGEGAGESSGVLAAGTRAGAIAGGAASGSGSGVTSVAALVRATGGFTVVGGDLDDHAGFAVVGHRLTLASGVGAEVLGVLLNRAHALGALPLGLGESGGTNVALPDVAVVLGRTGADPSDRLGETSGSVSAGGAEFGGSVLGREGGGLHGGGGHTVGLVDLY